MAQKAASVLLKGGLDLVTAQIAMPAGRAIGAINYEPDMAGYSRLSGYERYDGRDSPSGSVVPATVASRRAAIGAVPGTGPVRGVAVFDGHVYAFRDNDDGTSHMHVDSASGWTQQTFGYEMVFSAGTSELIASGTLTGGTSGATAAIERVVLRSGTWAGTAEGFLVLSSVTGTFVTETVTGSAGGSATGSALTAITLTQGGKFDFAVHNFRGAASTEMLYGANGEAAAFEWDGEVLAPIRTGTSAGVLDDYEYVLAANGDFVLAANGDFVILRADFDKPLWIEEFANHMFLGFRSGSLLFSSIGEPLEYITTTGAGEIGFGSRITGLLGAAATSLVIFARNRIGYLTGSDSATFELKPITTRSGAVPYSTEMMTDPVFVDDGGIRSLAAAQEFGDWRMGTVSHLVEPLMRAKRDAGVAVVGTVRAKARDQMWLFWDDGTGIVMYVGRGDPEILPFKLPITPYCAVAGELEEGLGERIFVGAEDGYVYEMGRGWSFDGLPIDAYIRLAFNNLGSPVGNKNFRRTVLDIVGEDDIALNVAYDVDYGGSQRTGAGRLLGDETDGMAIDFRDATAIIRDTTTPANDYVGPPGDILTYSGGTIAGLGKWVYNSAGILTQTTAGALPYEWDPATHEALGVLIEKARVNRCRWSQDFTNAVWTAVSCTVTANDEKAKDGTVTAARLAATAAADSGISQTITYASDEFSVSIFARKGTEKHLRITVSVGGSTANRSAWFNLETGEVGTVQSSITDTFMQDVGGGWYRCAVLFTASGTEPVAFKLASADNSTVATSGAYLHVWGAQVEQINSGPWPTSCIPTTTASVTRTKDDLTKTGGFGLSSSAGTFIVSIDHTRVEQSSNASIGYGALDDGADTFAESTSFFLDGGSVSTMRMDVVDNSVTQAQLTIGSFANTGNVGVAYTLNNTILALNGELSTADTACTMPSLSRMVIGSYYGGAVATFGGHVRGVLYLPRRATDAEMQDLTNPVLWTVDTDDISVSIGAPISTDMHGAIYFGQAVNGELTVDTPGFGRNIAIRVISSSDDKEQHTLQAATFKYSDRGAQR